MNFSRLIGFLAVAFGYFENLLRLQDLGRIGRELSRIKDFNRLLNAVGHQEDLYEIFVDASEVLLGQISGEIEKGNHDPSFLEESFNVEFNSNAIITHFRVSSLWISGSDCSVLVAEVCADSFSTTS